MLSKLVFAWCASCDEDGGVRSQNEPAPTSRVQPRTTGKTAVSLPTTAVHAQSRPGIYSTEPIRGSDVIPPSFWRTQGMESGYHGREDRFQRSSSSSGSDGQVAVNNSLSHLTQAGAPSSPIVTRSQSYIDPSTGAITKASKQGKEAWCLQTDLDSSVCCMACRIMLPACFILRQTIADRYSGLLNVKDLDTGVSH